MVDIENIKDFSMIANSGKSLILEDNDGKMIELQQLPDKHIQEFEKSNYSYDYLNNNIINNPELGYKMEITYQGPPGNVRKVYSYRR